MLLETFVERERFRGTAYRAANWWAVGATTGRTPTRPAGARTKHRKKKAWLWVAVTAMVTVFLVHTRRNTSAAKALLGDAFAGILTTDRWASYNWVSAERRQLCWSHLIRDFKSFLN